MLPSPRLFFSHSSFCSSILGSGPHLTFPLSPSICLRIFFLAFFYHFFVAVPLTWVFLAALRTRSRAGCRQHARRFIFVAHPVITLLNQLIYICFFLPWLWLLSWWFIYSCCCIIFLLSFFLVFLFSLSLSWIVTFLILIICSFSQVFFFCHYIFLKTSIELRKEN